VENTPWRALKRIKEELASSDVLPTTLPIVKKLIKKKLKYFIFGRMIRLAYPTCYSLSLFAHTLSIWVDPSVRAFYIYENEKRTTTMVVNISTFLLVQELV